MDVFQYTGRFQTVRGRIGGLPGWAKLLVFAAAVPGIVLIGLSILALLVSILALLLPTVPLYRLLSALAAGGGSPDEPATATDPFGFARAGGGAAEPQRKRVEATVIDPPVRDDDIDQPAPDGPANPTEHRT